MSALSVSGTSTYTSSPPQNLSNFDNIGLQIAFSSGVTGTLSVLCSVDGSVYDALTFNPALSQPTGTAINYLVNLNQLPYPWLKVQFVSSSGSGTLDVWLNSKDIN